MEEAYRCAVVRWRYVRESLHEMSHKDPKPTTFYSGNTKAQIEDSINKPATAILFFPFIFEKRVWFVCFCVINFFYLQSKLRRSKLARAQLLGDKQTVRQLRENDLKILNTNCGQQPDNHDFLKKLERRPCLTGHEDKNNRSQPIKPTAIKVTEKHMVELIQAVMRQQIPPPDDRTLRTLTELGDLLEKAQLLPLGEQETRGTMNGKPTPEGVGSRVSRKVMAASIRPATTPGIRLEISDDAGSQMETSAHRLSSSKVRNVATRAMCEKVQNIKNSPPKCGKENSEKTASHYRTGRPRPFTSPLKGHSLCHGNTKVEDTKMPLSRDVQLATVKMQEHQLTPQDGPGHMLGSRRPSHQNMFEETIKLNPAAMLLEAERAMDPTPRVGAFIKSLQELQKRSRDTKQRGDGFDRVVDVKLSEEKDEELIGDRKFDYYATKMAVHMASIKRDSFPSIPGTPDELNRRMVGNQAIRSLTMPCLRLDFERDDYEILDNEL